MASHQHVEVRASHIHGPYYMSYNWVQDSPSR